MKKNEKIISLLSPIIFLGIVFLTLGIMRDMLWSKILGGCLIGIYILAMQASYLSVLLKSVKKKNNDSNGYKQTEAKLVEEINSSEGISNEVALAQHTTSNFKNTWENLSSLERVKILSIWLVCLCGFVAFVTCLFLNLTLYAGIAFGCIFLFIFTIILVSFIVESRLMSKKNIDYSSPSQTGTVLSCLMSTMVTTSKGSNTAYVKNQKTRVKRVAYKLKINLQGKIVTAYSHNPYNAGDEIEMRPHKRRKNVFFIDD